MECGRWTIAINFTLSRDSDLTHGRIAYVQDSKFIRQRSRRRYYIFMRPSTMASRRRVPARHNLSAAGRPAAVFVVPLRRCDLCLVARRCPSVSVNVGTRKLVAPGQQGSILKLPVCYIYVFKLYSLLLFLLLRRLSPTLVVYRFFFFAKKDETLFGLLENSEV